MYFDFRLWRLTAGLRGRIALGTFLGLLALGVGIARFAFLGIPRRLFAGAARRQPALASRPPPSPCCPRAARPAPHHHRAPTRGGVQEEAARRLYDKIAELGPAWFAGERTGGVMLSIVDGVEQLQSFFGQYLPQSSVAALAPLAIFAFMACWDVPVAARDAGAPRCSRWSRPTGFVHDRAAAASSRERQGVQGVRRGVPRRGAGPADPEGVRPERRLRPPCSPSKARALSDTTMRVLSTSVMTRGITDLGMRARRRRGAGARRLARVPRRDEPRGAADRADGRHRDVPPAARPAHGAASGHGRAVGGRRHQRAAATAGRPRRSAAPVANRRRHASRAACSRPSRSRTCASPIPAAAARRMTGLSFTVAAGERSASSARAAPANLGRAAAAAPVRSADAARCGSAASDLRDARSRGAAPA